MLCQACTAAILFWGLFAFSLAFNKWSTCSIGGQVIEFQLVVYKNVVYKNVGIPGQKAFYNYNTTIIETCSDMFHHLHFIDFIHTWDLWSREI